MQVPGQYASILNALGDGAHLVDSELRITLINPSFCNWLSELGLPEVLPGQTLPECFPFLPENVWEEYRQVLETGEVLETEETMEIRGRPFVTRSTKIPLRQNGQVTSVLTVIRDLTASREMESALSLSREQFQGLYESMVEGVAICDLLYDDHGRAVDYVVRSVNPAYARMTGIPMEEAVGVKASELYGSEVPPFLDLVEPVARTGTPTRFEAYSEFVERHFAISAFSPLRGRFAIVMEDVTDQHQHEQERDGLITELEARNAELERFTYSVSHDLKSPLITINGFLALLESALDDQDSETQRRYIRRIATATDRMAELLEDLLELSRVGRMVNPPEEFCLIELVREAAELTAGRLTEAGVELEIDPALPPVRGDRRRLLEVLQNLIDNAAKFMGDQSAPRIRINTRPDPDALVVAVEDNGLGIEPAFHEKIFQVFGQLDPRHEGSGVGLALARRIVEVHGGSMWVESSGIPGEGATFLFSLGDPDA